MKKNLILLAIVALVAVSCKDKKNEDNREDYNRETVNACIYDIMETYYLWNNNIPQQRRLKFNEKPDVFFNNLLFSGDPWSFISDDSKATNAQLDGNPYSMGFSPQFWYYNDKSNVLIIVEYVYPGSPADRAGLKRGDIILDIDGEEMTPKNYYDLYSRKSATYTLGTYDPKKNTLNDNGTKLKLEAAAIKADPSIYDTIYMVGNKPVGYLVYTAFASDTSYFSSMDAIFDNFKSAGVKDLILDLRYNRGGSIETAGHLAAAIAPADVVNNHEVLITYIYNDILTDYFNSYKAQNQDDETIYRIPGNTHNADIENLYVLGTNNTASASELIIVGLQPYMNVKLIGTETYGKYTGMFIFDSDVEGCKDLENWAVLPVCMKYANSVGYTDFDNGLKPDYEIDDNLLNAYPLGDPNDPVIATALDVVGGLPLTAKSAYVNPFTPLRTDNPSAINNLIINK